MRQTCDVRSATCADISWSHQLDSSNDCRSSRQVEQAGVTGASPMLAACHENVIRPAAVRRDDRWLSGPWSLGGPVCNRLRVLQEWFTASCIFASTLNPGHRIAATAAPAMNPACDSSECALSPGNRAKIAVHLRFRQFRARMRHAKPTVFYVQAAISARRHWWSPLPARPLILYPTFC